MINSVFINLGASNHSIDTREENDFYSTEPRAVEELLKYEKFNKYILEPACGQGHISKVLKDNGYIVKSQDLINRGYGEYGIDFLKTNMKWKGDIITNPPYKYAKQFVEKALEIVEEKSKIAMLLKIQFLESQSRYKLFKKNNPKYIYVFSKRVNCWKNGIELNTNGAICYSWYIWEKGYKEETIVRWIGE